MKPSRRNTANAQARADKRAGKAPLKSKYAAKVAAETARLGGHQPRIIPDA